MRSRAALSGMQALGDIRYRSGEAGRYWHATLRKIFAAATAAAEGRERLFQESGHVVRLPGGLSEDKRGLRGFCRQKTDDCGRQLACEFLRKNLEVGQFSIRKGAGDNFAAVRFRSFGEQGGSLSCG